MMTMVLQIMSSKWRWADATPRDALRDPRRRLHHGGASPSVRQLTGTVSFLGATGGMSSINPECRGVPAFSTADLATGQQIRLLDEAGTVIGTGVLENTTAHNAEYCSARS
jgi:hypothetical protein